MAILKYWNGSDWVTANSDCVKTAGDTMTGDLSLQWPAAFKGRNACKAFGTYSRIASPGNYTVWGYGVSSVTSGAGVAKQQVNFEVPMPDEHYTIAVSNGMIFDGRVSVNYLQEVGNGMANGTRTVNGFVINGFPLTGTQAVASYNNFEFGVWYDDDKPEIVPQSSSRSLQNENDKKGLVIIYEEGDGVGVCHPCKNSAWSLEEIGLKDVPNGQRFKFAKNEDLPQDMNFRDAWTADFSDHDGVGMGATEFFKNRGY